MPQKPHDRCAVATDVQKRVHDSWTRSWCTFVSDRMAGRGFSCFQVAHDDPYEGLTRHLADRIAAVCACGELASITAPAGRPGRETRATGSPESRWLGRQTSSTSRADRSDRDN